MTPQECDLRLKFLDLTDRDCQALRALRPMMEQHVGTVVDTFYGHLLAFDETRRLLHDHTTVERLKKLQRDYLLRVTEGNFDLAYFQDRLRIGRTHERVGLSPRWYLSAYSFFFELLIPLVADHFQDAPDRARQTMVALEKAFMLDASLAMDAYVASDRFRHLQQLESIVRDSADAIFMLDSEKRFRTWNHAAERILGWKSEEILGHHVNLLIPEDIARADEPARIDAELATQHYCHLQTVRLARDGRRVPVDLTVSILRDPTGRPIGRSVILRDITDRKRLEEAKLQSERLAVIGAMSAKLAHEIRNPLSSITLNIDLVRDEIDTLGQHNPATTAESRTLLKAIDSEVRRIQRVVEDYLKFARLPKIRQEKVSINEVLMQGMGFLQSLFDASNVTVETHFEQSLPAVYADESQLWQAVLNLIRNALEAMPDGGMLTLRTQRDADAVVVSIADTGKGMTVEERDQVFKPFFSTKIGGTGLGLPLTQQIVSEHGGFIRCDSEPGKGTTFFIHLKFSQET
jgi:PAS domain S-box-containing protein